MQRTLPATMDRSSEVELKVAEIYDRFAKVFESETLLSQFWLLFAEAERYHSLLIQMQKLGLKSDPDPEKLASWNKDLDATIESLEGIIKRSDDGWKPTVTEAFDAAEVIEARAPEVQGRALEFMDSSSVAEVLAKLHEEELEHMDKLVQARAKFDPNHK